MTRLSETECFESYHYFHGNFENDGRLKYTHISCFLKSLFQYLILLEIRPRLSRTILVQMSKESKETHTAHENCIWIQNMVFEWNWQQLPFKESATGQSARETDRCNFLHWFLLSSLRFQLSLPSRK